MAKSDPRSPYPFPLTALVCDVIRRILMIVTNKHFSCSEGEQRADGKVIPFSVILPYSV